MPAVAYPVLDARISPVAAVERAKVYFRAGQYFDYYAVEMREYAGRFEAVLPQPHPDTTDVAYYIEAVGLSSESSRTPEFVAQVLSEDECARQGGAGRYLGARPPLRIVSTASGASAVPPGFLIEDDDPPAAVATSSSGKGGWRGRRSTGTRIGIAAGGAVALGFLISELDDSDEAPASPVTP